MRTHYLKKHLWIDSAQNQKLDKLKKELGLNASDVFRMAIDKDYPYANVYARVAHQLKKQGTNLNQIAKHANTKKEIDGQVLIVIEELRQQQNAILDVLRSNYDD